MWMIFKCVGSNDGKRIALNLVTCQWMLPVAEKTFLFLKVIDAAGVGHYVDATLDEVRECMEITHDNAMVDFDLWRKRNTKKPEIWYAVLSTLAKPDKEVIYGGEESDEIHVGYSKGIIGAAEKKEVGYIHLYQREKDEFDNIYYVHYKTLTRVEAFKDND